MTSFWIITLVMSAVAAAFVLVPAWLQARRGQFTESLVDRDRMNVEIYKDQIRDLQTGLEQGDLTPELYEQQKLEMEQELLYSVRGEGSPASDQGVAERSLTLPATFALLVPLVAFVFYADWGFSLGSINDLELARDLDMVSQSGHDQADMSSAIGELRQRLQGQPENDEGWFLLARSLTSLGEYVQAVEAYDHLLSRYPADAKLMSYKAEVLYLMDNRTLTDRVRKVVNETLALAPDLPNMLELLGMDAFSRGDFQGSISYFQRVLAQGIEGERAIQINQVIARANELMGASGDMQSVSSVAGAPQSTGSSSTASSSTASTSTASAAVLNVLVELAPGVSADRSDTVFVFARAVAGPPMPLAVSRLTVADLPKLVRLDDSMSMMQGMNISSAGSVKVVARISKSGQPTASPGDWEAASGPITVAQADGVIKLVIATQVP